MLKRDGWKWSLLVTLPLFAWRVVGEYRQAKQLNEDTDGGMLRLLTSPWLGLAITIGLLLWAKDYFPHRPPPPRPEPPVTPDAGPPSSTLAMLQQMGARFDLSPSNDFDVDVSIGGYYIMASTEEAVSPPTMPGLWVVIYGVVITNRTDSKLPLELSIEVGMRRNGSYAISSTSTATVPAWILRQDLENDHPFDRLLNLPPKEAQHGFLAVRFDHSVQAEAQVSDLTDLAHSRPYWVAIENKLTGVRREFPANPIAHQAQRGRESK